MLRYQNQIALILVLIVEVVKIVTDNKVQFKIKESHLQYRQDLTQVEKATKVLQDLHQDELEDKR